MRIVTRQEEMSNGLDAFLSIPPDHPEAFELAKKAIAARLYPRQELSNLLVDYNLDIGNDESAIANAKKLADDGTYCIVTGQQLGFLGGPAYTVLKAISCLITARETGAVPIFWLATEDHDIAEIEKTFTLDNEGNLKKYKLSLPKGISVEDLELSQKNVDTINTFFHDASPGKVPFSIDEGDSYARVMAKVLVELFRGTGLLFLEPKLLRNLARPLFSREISEASSIKRVLRETTEKLKEAGGLSVLDVDEQGTNLFYKEDNLRRTKISRNEKGSFVVGNCSYSDEDLLELIDTSPERFSPNAAARPLIQSALIPTLGYVAGPTELEYHRQLNDYFNFHDVPMPWLVPRLSVTFVTKKAEEYLNKINRNPWENIPEQWDAVYSDLSDLKNSKEKKRVAKERCERIGIPYNALHYLNNLLQPYGKRQERTLNWLWLQGMTEEDIIQGLLDAMSWDERGHHYCFLS